MNLIDFHCDTLSECYNRKSELYKNDLHIDLERGKRVFNKYCQVFAVWIPDEKRGDEAYDYFNNVYAFFEKQLIILWHSAVLPVKWSMPSAKIKLLRFCLLRAVRFSAAT